MVLHRSCSPPGAMRLLQQIGENNFSLPEDLARSYVPFYAILFHTWHGIQGNHRPEPSKRH